VLHVKPSDLSDKDRLYRVAFFNTLSGIRTPFMAGTLGQVANLGLFNSIVHIGANPPLLGMVFRPATVPRHTLENILESKWYTLNSVPESLVKQAHQTSAKYDADVSEFDALGWKPHYEPNIPAPFVGDSPLRMALTFVEKHDIVANNTIFLVGEVKHLWIDDRAIADTGEILHDVLETALVSGLDAYYTRKKIGNQPFARP
jgi:flavin reductase (DIM6/NTAB) family NADH-FMN oxidoreductase RutF